MTDTKLEIILAAQDQTKKTLDLFKGSIDGITGTINNLKTGMVALAGTYGVGKLVSGMNEAIRTASDLEEAASKFNIVFAGQTDIAGEWAEILVDGYAMSTREAKQYLSSVQDLLVPMGVQADEAGRLSNEIVKLSADLGSFNNQPTAKVMDDIQSALVGNYETMKKYGVVLSAATVEQEALRMGMANSKDELTAANKAMGAYNIILRGSAAAIGDMERTADGHANTTKRLDAAWEDFSGTLGDKFMPAATRVKDVTADILRNLTDAIKGPSIEEQISAQDAYIAKLMASQEKAVIDTQERIQKRQQRMLDSFGGRSGPAGKASQEILDLVKERQEAEMKMDPHALDITRAKEYREYLLDIKRLRDIDAHNEKMSGLSNVKAEVTDIGISDDASKKFESEMKALVRSMEGYQADVWDPANYDLDYGYDELSAEIENVTEAEQKRQKVLKESFDLQIALSKAIEDTYDVDAGIDFTKEIEMQNQEFKALEDSAGKFSKSMEDAFSGWASTYSQTLTDMLWDSELTFDGILESFGRMMTQMVIQKQISGVADGLFDFNWSGLFSTSAKGNVFPSTGINAYENQVLNKPTFFQFATGIGVAGEAGYEAIMPLRRMPSGNLGVEATGSSGGVVKVDLRIYNNGQPVEPTRQESSVDGDTLFLSIWMDAADRNRMGVRDMIKGISDNG